MTGDDLADGERQVVLMAGGVVKDGLDFERHDDAAEAKLRAVSRGVKVKVGSAGPQAPCVFEARFGCCSRGAVDSVGSAVRIRGARSEDSSIAAAACFLRRWVQDG